MPRFAPGTAFGGLLFMSFLLVSVGSATRRCFLGLAISLETWVYKQAPSKKYRRGSIRRKPKKLSVQ
jgi:hypothetical protein